MADAIMLKNKAKNYFEGHTWVDGYINPSGTISPPSSPYNEITSAEYLLTSDFADKIIFIEIPAGVDMWSAVCIFDENYNCLKRIVYGGNNYCSFPTGNRIVSFFPTAVFTGHYFKFSFRTFGDGRAYAIKKDILN